MPSEPPQSPPKAHTPYRTDRTAQRFAELFPDAGRVLDLEASQSELMTQAHHAMRIGTAYWPPPFAQACGFTFKSLVYDSLDPDAFTAYRFGEYWISVASGLIYVSAELSVRAAAILPIPKSSQPRPDFDRDRGFGFKFKPEDFKGRDVQTDKFFRQTQAFDSARMRVMNTLWLDAQTLVWRHELFHASLGHARFADHNLNMSVFAEVTDLQLFAATDLNGIRALEFHADWAAFGSMLKMVRSDLDPAGSDLAETYGLRFRAMVMTMAVILFPLFFRVAEKRFDKAPETHPSATTRLHTFLLRLSEIEQEIERNEWELGAEDAIRALNRAGKSDPDLGRIAKMFSQAAIDASDRERRDCIEKLDTLQDGLNQYAVLVLGHPHQGALTPLDAAPS